MVNDELNQYDEFLKENLVADENRSTVIEYILKRYSLWTNENGRKPLSKRDCLYELKRRFTSDVVEDVTRGHCLRGYRLKEEEVLESSSEPEGINSQNAS